MIVSTQDRYQSAVRQAEPTLSSASRLAICIFLEQEYLTTLDNHASTDESDPYSLLEEGFSDDRKDRVYHKLWSATLGGCLVLAPMHQYPKRITELGLGSPSFVCDIARQATRTTVHTINYFGSRSRATMPRDMPNPPRIMSSNLELGSWGRDPRIRGRQSVVAARFEADDGLDWNWRHIAEQSLEALEPGGWLELQMVGALTSDDGSANGTALCAVPRHLAKNLAGGNRDNYYYYDCDREPQDAPAAVAGAATAAWAKPGHQGVLANAGFEEVTVVRRRWWSTPVGHRSDLDETESRLADMYLSEVEEAQLLEAQCEEIRTYLRWSPELAARFLRTLRDEIRDPSIQAYFPVYVVYGRKPFA